MQMLVAIEKHRTNGPETQPNNDKFYSLKCCIVVQLNKHDYHLFSFGSKFETLHFVKYQQYKIYQSKSLGMTERKKESENSRENQ